MVPKGKVITATLAEVAAALKAGVPGLDGAKAGDRWEGMTGRQLRVDVYARPLEPGVTLAWEFHDGVARHQHARHSVLKVRLPQLAAEIAAADRRAVPSRFVDEVEADVPAADPVLALAATPVVPPPPPVVSPPPPVPLVPAPIVSQPPPVVSQPPLPVPTEPDQDDPDWGDEDGEYDDPEDADAEPDPDVADEDDPAE